MKANAIRANAVCLPLADASVDLIVTSPPYFALRSYRDSCDTCHGRVVDGPQMAGPSAKSTLGGSKANRSGTDPSQEVPPDPECPACHGSGKGHYDGQVGSEPTSQAFLEALWACTDEWWRVLKPTGSLWVNLGDKYAGSGGHNNANLAGAKPQSFHVGTGRKLATVAARADAVLQATRRNAPDRYNQESGGARPKSLMGLPWRYALGCIDRGWILRRDLVWAKPNGLPESVTDRCRSSHEYWFHLTKQGSYFAAMDEIRTEHAPKTLTHRGGGVAWGNDDNPDNHWGNGGVRRPNPLGALPGSVWNIPSEPLIIPEAVQAHYNLPDHFAAFPQEWPRRLILGWSSGGVCTACGQGRRPVAVVDLGVKERETPRYSPDNNHGGHGSTLGSRGTTATITGYACACPDDSAPTKGAVVLDPFMGTGTVLGVAEALGRTGIGTDLSMDYARLARWRVEKSGHFQKTSTRTWRERQGAFDFGDPA